jgi:hypothetical protein
LQLENDMRKLALHGALFSIAVVLVACGGDDQKSSGFEKKPAGSEGGFGSNENTSGGLGNKNPSAPSGDGCAAEARLVYVVSMENDLYSFAPDTVTFTKVGNLKCPANGATPNSMAIDRSGNAWVNYSDGGLFKVSTKDASCSSTPFQRGQSGFVKFGMAFATNGASSTDETLYVSGITDALFGGEGQGLAKIDLGTFKLTPIGDYSGGLRGSGAELTGTGDGRLFGFFTTQPATLAQIDKGAGSTSNDKSLSGVSTGLAWAFSFWGGDFWFYTSNGVSASTVTQLKASGDGSIKTAKADVGGFKIVGAGVSTCAPTAPPR